MKCLLIDCNEICYRAKHGVPVLSHEDARTNVIFGFLNSLIELVNFHRTRNVIFCWDGFDNIRKTQYPLYKQKRRDKRDQRTDKEKMEDALAFEQFSLLRTEILPLIGFRNIFFINKLESDDLIARLVMSHTHHQFTIISSDEDMFQLLPYCRIFSFRKKRIYTSHDFKKQYGIHPKQWPMVKAIAGCKSDNVPGIRGVGETKALDYLTKRMNRNTLTYRKIKQGKKDISLFLKLVKLPHEQTPKLRLRKDQLSYENFMILVNHYGMISMIDGPQARAWFSFLKDTRHGQ